MRRWGKVIIVGSDNDVETAAAHVLSCPQGHTHGGLQPDSLPFSVKIAGFAQLPLDFADNVLPGGEILGMHRHRVVARRTTVTVPGGFVHGGEKSAPEMNGFHRCGIRT
jgi:hypothetical protein